MLPRVSYLDSSALVKLVVAEAGSAALAEGIKSGPSRASSIVAAVEVRLAARRRGVDADLERAEEVLAGTSLIRLGSDVAKRAGQLTELRALDAIHLATALSLGADLDAFIAYDRRLLTAAVAAGLPTLSPGVG